MLTAESRLTLQFLAGKTEEYEQMRRDNESLCFEVEEIEKYQSLDGSVVWTYGVTSV